MTLPTGSSQAPFTLSVLINDQRYRGYTFQFIALLLLIFTMAYLGWNLTQNLAAKGLNISYQFLQVPAGYDINQRLIEYNSQSTHLRASIVGVLNTLLVAFLGCITATVVGVLAGILRLSNNWIVAKLMAVYVEIFRNVPVLIWILIISGIFIVALPQPRSFRGENPEASMLWDAFAFTGRGIYAPKPIFYEGSTFVIGAFILSLVAIFFYRRYARKKLYDDGILLPMRWPSIAIIFVPALLVYFVMGSPIGLEYPVLKGFNFKGGVSLKPEYLALWLALSYYTACFIAEIVRGGILAIHKGQREAAYALGLTPNRTLQLAIIPQALPLIIPPLTSNYLNLTKNSSLAVAIGYFDIVATIGTISLMQTGKEVETMVIVLSIYLCLSLIISGAMNLLNYRLKIKVR